MMKSTMPACQTGPAADIGTSKSNFASSRTMAVWIRPTMT